jgi:hypothetical protein
MLLITINRFKGCDRFFFDADTSDCNAGVKRIKSTFAVGSSRQKKKKLILGVDKSFFCSILILVRRLMRLTGSPPVEGIRIFEI